jgi:hypothetical protein
VSLRLLRNGLVKHFNYKSLFVGLFLCGNTLSVIAQDCAREPRDVFYDGTPETVYVSPGQRAAVVFPESRLPGAHPEVPEGLTVNVTPTPNKITITVDNAVYTGLLSIDGGSGKTYILRLLAREGCADSLVTLKHMEEGDTTKLARDSNGKLRGLMWYLIKGETPEGYRKVQHSKLTDEQRVIMRQGSVEFRLEQELVGPRFIGTTYTVINKGRTPFRIAIENIDYSDPRVKETLGYVRKVAMLPTDRRLGPAPEFVSDIYADSHRGLLFIVSEKQ